MPYWARYSSRALRCNSGSTRPLWGSVPSGRRNKRMWGSGLSQFKTHVLGSCWRSIYSRIGFKITLTGEWRSVANRGFAAHQCHAIPIRSEDGSWEVSWRVPWGESRDCVQETREHGGEPKSKSGVGQRTFSQQWNRIHSPIFVHIVSILFAVFDATGGTHGDGRIGERGWEASGTNC